MKQSISDLIKAAKVVAQWDEETKSEVMALAEELKAQRSTAVPVMKKKPGRKPKAKVAKDPNAPKRKYTRKAKVEGAEAEVAEFASA